MISVGILKMGKIKLEYVDRGAKINSKINYCENLLAGNLGLLLRQKCSGERLCDFVSLCVVTIALRESIVNFHFQDSHSLVNLQINFRLTINNPICISVYEF